MSSSICAACKMGRCDQCSGQVSAANMPCSHNCKAAAETSRPTKPTGVAESMAMLHAYNERLNSEGVVQGYPQPIYHYRGDSWQGWSPTTRQGNWSHAISYSPKTMKTVSPAQFLRFLRSIPNGTPIYVGVAERDHGEFVVNVSFYDIGGGSNRLYSQEFLLDGKENPTTQSEEIYPKWNWSTTYEKGQIVRWNPSVHEKDNYYQAIQGSYGVEPWKENVWKKLSGRPIFASKEERLEDWHYEEAVQEQKQGDCIPHTQGECVQHQSLEGIKKERDEAVELLKAICEHVRDEDTGDSTGDSLHYLKTIPGLAEWWQKHKPLSERENRLKAISGILSELLDSKGMISKEQATEAILKALEEKDVTSGS